MIKIGPLSVEIVRGLCDASTSGRAGHVMLYFHQCGAQLLDLLYLNLLIGQVLPQCLVK